MGCVPVRVGVCSYVRGQSLQMEELNDCDVYLFDHADSVYVDMCKNCRIFIGPVASRYRQTRASAADDTR